MGLQTNPDAKSARRTAARKISSASSSSRAVTLASIGDGVIVTDATRPHHLYEPSGRNLTGWSAAEAIGQPCGTIFHIINETTRKPVPESPVEKVLAPAWCRDWQITLC